MHRAPTTTIALFATATLGAPVLGGGWADYVNETTLRLPASHNNASLSFDDEEEKDYAWGDVDQDGDIDLVCVRKQPFTSTGKRVNVLFMNEGIAEGHAVNGVFADRTAQYASASDVGGDNGFNTPTNDRDVFLVDVDGDGWLDMVTAPTLTDNQAKHLSHPRVYMNLGESAGAWQGFRYEDARIPQMHPTAGPRFCSVGAGDVTGNGAPDLYFGDYDSGGGQIMDYNNRLLVNDGNGFFTDETTSRLTNEMSLSAFGAASVVADINDDGVNDVVKQTSLSSPTHIAVTYNDPLSEGFFDLYDTVYGNAPYFVSVHDLNQDGRLDLIITDDGTDRYMLNTGNDAQRADFLTLTFPSGPSAGFGSNSIAADLNNDGFEDVMIADVDVDIPGCGGRLHIYRNLGNLPNVSFQEQGEIIPNAMLTGTHDVAVFDINGDNWLDLVIGRCAGTEIWMNVPPTGLIFSYPDGLPGNLAPDQAQTFRVALGTFGGAQHVEGTGKLFHSVNGAAFVETDMTYLGNDEYEAVLPGVPCTSNVRFYVSAQEAGGGTFTDPANAPAATYDATASNGIENTVDDDIEGDVSGWTLSADPSTTSGFWEQVDPHFTIAGPVFVAPADDATQGLENVMAFVTEDAGFDDAPPGLADIDNGPVYLETPEFDLEGTDGTITYARWMYCNQNGFGQDFLVTEISNDGGANYVEVDSTSGTSNGWESVSFVASDFVATTSNMRVRFVVSDIGNTSISEAGIDNFTVEVLVCGSDCVGDIDESGDVGFGDLLGVLSAWGSCPGCPQDLDGDDSVGFSDVLVVLAAWGPCE